MISKSVSILISYFVFKIAISTFIIFNILQDELKAVDTIGSCQRLAFTVGVSQHIHKTKTCENLSSIGHRTCKIIMKEQTLLSHEVVCV